MKIISLTLIAIAIALLSGAIFYTPSGAEGAQLEYWDLEDLDNVEDGEFICPEYFSSATKKKEEIEKFLIWTKSVHPDWSLDQILNFRFAVLKHYACKITLSKIGQAGG